MFPIDPPAPEMVTTSLYVSSELLARAKSLAKTDVGSRGRNKLLVTLLAFGVDIYPLLKHVQKPVLAFAKQEGLSYPQAIARLVEKGLKSVK